MYNIIVQVFHVYTNYLIFQRLIEAYLNPTDNVTHILMWSFMINLFEFRKISLLYNS